MIYLSLKIAKIRFLYTIPTLTPNGIYTWTFNDRNTSPCNESADQFTWGLFKVTCYFFQKLHSTYNISLSYSDRWILGSWLFVYVWILNSYIFIPYPNNNMESLNHRKYLKYTVLMYLCIIYQREAYWL